MVAAYPKPLRDTHLRILDPALGEGQLALSLLGALAPHSPASVEIHGYDTDARAIRAALVRVATRFPAADLHFRDASFLSLPFFAHPRSLSRDLFKQGQPVPKYDLIIANPPYVRTQVLGRANSRILARQWGLTGRIDLYYAFILAISDVLAPEGIAGVIVSNRFMTTKSGGSIRKALPNRFDIKRIWDLGDTKLFEAAVLPSVLILGSKTEARPPSPPFSSIYETSDASHGDAPTPIDALDASGVVRLPDGRRFRIQHGVLQKPARADDVWRVSTPAANAWLETVTVNAWSTFGSAGSVHVGVKTCADSIFVRDDWQSFPRGERPELLRPLMTHRVARPYRARTDAAPTRILYPHEVVEGERRAVTLDAYPRAAAYLRKHRQRLEKREYLIASGRRWYEIWVPHDPESWHLDKIVFRDISATPTFWVDLDGMVVNGDCYWWVPTEPDETLLWLAAAVGNSGFISQFYDNRFNNRLYAGRRRFMAQYVKRFPLPDPARDISQELALAAKRAYVESDQPHAEQLRGQIDDMVLRAFGLG